MEHPSGSNEQEASFKVDSLNWKDKLTNLHQRLASLEGAMQDSLVGMTSSHNPTTFASSASPVIDSGATHHVTSVRSEFQSYTSTTHRRVRIAYGCYNHIAGKGTV